LSNDPELKSGTDAWGVDLGFEDAFGNWQHVGAETRTEIRRAMRLAPDELPESAAPVLVVDQGHPTCVLANGDLVLESGEVLRSQAILPAHLPVGYHRLIPDSGDTPVTVIVSPGASYLPPKLKIWGWAAQLYATRSKQSWGIGDFADLRHLARWSALELNAGMLMVNPLHAASPGLPQQPSPYFPSSRLFRNPLYLAIPELEGAAAYGTDLDALANAGRSLNSRRLIDRDAIYGLKMQAARTIFAVAAKEDDSGFAAYRSREGILLDRFSTYCALAEEYGSAWRRWPSELRHPASQAVARFATAHAEALRFHQWLQWQLDLQLAAASREIAVMQDLPVGFDPDGADAWMWQDLLAQDVGIGAPPDLFNTQGQDWGLPPFIPHRLRAAAYEPFVRTVRATLRNAGGLRIDHILGLFRLYWVPSALGPRNGAYVRYNTDELLAIIAVESHRASAFIVGEDLGTVEEGVREKLARNHILSYRVMWFEEEPPAAYPELALAAISTHDLPTLLGMWTGADEEAQRRLGMQPDSSALQRTRGRLRKLASLRRTSPSTEVILKTHQTLATAPCCVVTASLDDVLGVAERPNMPATTNDQNPNWSIALPRSLEEIQSDPTVRAVGAALARPG
jgi:4-alpha-glucanotransferase